MVQILSFNGLDNFGLGLTLIVKLNGSPGQPFKIGVTVINPEIGFAVGFAVVKLIEPLPLAAKPIEVLLLVQLNCVPGKLALKLIVPLFTLSLYVVSFRGLITGVGFT